MSAMAHSWSLTEQVSRSVLSAVEIFLSQDDSAPAADAVIIALHQHGLGLRVEELEFQ